MSATFDDAPRNNKFDLPTIARVWYFLSGVLVTINGFVFIGEGFNNVVNRCTGNNCVGPALRWGDWTGGRDDGQNAAWRSVFPLGPNRLFQLWTGVFLGVIMIAVHFPGFKFSFCTRTWLHVGLFSIFVGLFGAFPYSGNLGLLVGFFMVPLPVMCLFLAFTAYRHEPTTLNFKVSGCHLGCLVDNEIFIIVARYLSFATGLAVFVIGIIHICVQEFNWCPVGGLDVDCIGPSLRWNQNSAPFVRAVNGPGSGGWGDEIFTFAVDAFFPLWGPVVLGYFTILQHLQGHTWQTIFGSWPRVFFWFMFLGLFAAMGYSGNLGILVGFACILVALMALLISFGGAANTKTHLEIRVLNFGNKVTMTTAGTLTQEEFKHYRKLETGMTQEVV